MTSFEKATFTGSVIFTNAPSFQQAVLAGVRVSLAKGPRHGADVAVVLAGGEVDGWVANAARGDHRGQRQLAENIIVRQTCSCGEGCTQPSLARISVALPPYVFSRIEGLHFENPRDHPP